MSETDYALALTRMPCQAEQPLVPFDELTGEQIVLRPANALGPSGFCKNLTSSAAKNWQLAPNVQNGFKLMLNGPVSQLIRFSKLGGAWES